MKETIDDNIEENKQSEQKDFLINKNPENEENEIKIKISEPKFQKNINEKLSFDDETYFTNYYYDEENEKLIHKEEKKEKLGLARIFERLKEDLDSKEYETLNDIYELYINNEDITKKFIKENTGRCALDFMCCFISPVFIIINLIGIFESISIMNNVFQILKNSVVIYFKSLTTDKEKIEKFSINDINNNYNFFNLLLQNSKNDTFDFNLMMFMAFLGDICIKSKGFIISTSIFAGINVISFLLIANFSFNDYNPENNTYSLFKIIYLLICWLSLFVGVGSSALLSQQIIIESYDKYNKHLIKLNEKTRELWGEKMELIILEKLKRKARKDLENREELRDIKIDEIEKKLEEEENIKKDINEDEKEENEKKDLNKDEILISNTEEEKIGNIAPNEDESKEEFEGKEKITFKDILSNIKEVKEVPNNYRRAKTIFKSEEEEDKKEKKKKNNKKVLKKEKDNKNKFSYFFIICLTTITGYFFKYLFNIIIFERNEIKKYEYMNIIGCYNNETCFDINLKDKNFSETHPNEFNEVIQRIINDDKFSFYTIIIIYIIAIIVSIVLYIIFDQIFITEQNEKEKDKNLKEKKDKNLKEKKDKSGKNTNQKNDENENKYKACEICGYLIYSENIILNEDSQKCECFKLICETLRNCIILVIQSLCVCFAGFIAKEEKEKISEEDICCFNGSLNKICCCCCNFKKNDYNKRQEFFCYCYQAKTKQSWLNKFMTSNVQKKIFPYMFEYFLLKMLVIGFEKKYNEIKNNKSKNYSNYNKDINNTLYINFVNLVNETNNTDSFNNTEVFFTNDDLYSFLSFIVTFFLFYYFTFTFNGYISFLSLDSKYDDDNDNKISKWSTGILDGTHGILLVNGLFSLILSSLYLSNNEYYLFQYDNFVFIPILMNKFYHFMLIYFCISYSDENKKFELLTGSTLISLYLTLWDLILYILGEYISLKVLFIIQIVLSSFPCLAILLFIVHFLYTQLCWEWREKLAFLCCIFSHIFCFGAFWADMESCNKLIDNIFPGELNKIHAFMPFFFQSFSYLSYTSYSERDHCCEGSCYCCIDFLKYVKCLDCLDYCGCYFCNCCVCYDCCDCCAFCWCCDDYCSCCCNCC